MKKPVAKKQKSSNKKYNLTLSFNDQIFTVETDDLAESIMSVAPQFLKTRVLFLIKKGDLVCEKMLLLLQGRRLFMNKIALEVFINKLVFTKNG